MQSNSLSKVAMVLGLLVGSLYMVFDLFTSGGNVVAQFYRYALIGGGLFGLLSPRFAVYLLIALTAYLDFTKRLMILDSGVSKIDLYYVLGVSPAVMSGIAAYTLYTSLINPGASRPGLIKLAILTFSMAGLLGALGVLGATSRFQALGDSVNAVVYILLLPSIAMLFRTPEDLRQLLKGVLLIYTPAVLYMLVHWFRAVFLEMNPPIFGWELDYVKSGMTIEVRQLAERRFRPFGTFNSAANASMVFAAFFGLVMSGLWKQPFRGHPGGGGRFSRGLLAILILIAMYATYSRTGWLFAVVILMVPALFKNRAATVMAYGVGLVSVVSLMLASPYLLKHKILNEISSELYSAKRTEEWSQVTNIATLNDRLEGFYALVKSRKIWTPFGFKFAYPNPEAVRQSILSHDALSTALMKYGYVPLGLAGIFGLVMLKRMHGYIHQEKDPLARTMAATCLAVALVLCTGTLVNSAQLVTYPVNFWIWFMFSCVVSLMFWRNEQPLVQLEPGLAMDPGPRARPPLKKHPLRLGGKVMEA